jgi:hypothetical protein
MEAFSVSRLIFHVKHAKSADALGRVVDQFLAANKTVFHFIRHPTTSQPPGVVPFVYTVVSTLFLSAAVFKTIQLSGRGLQNVILSSQDRLQEYASEHTKQRAASAIRRHTKRVETHSNPKPRPRPGFMSKVSTAVGNGVEFILSKGVDVHIPFVKLSFGGNMMGMVYLSLSLFVKRVTAKVVKYISGQWRQAFSGRDKDSVIQNLSDNIMMFYYSLLMKHSQAHPEDQRTKSFQMEVNKMMLVKLYQQLDIRNPDLWHEIVSAGSEQEIERLTDQMKQYEQDISTGFSVRRIYDATQVDMYNRNLDSRVLPFLTVAVGYLAAAAVERDRLVSGFNNRLLENHNAYSWALWKKTVPVMIQQFQDSAEYKSYRDLFMTLQNTVAGMCCFVYMELQQTLQTMRTSSRYNIPASFAAALFEHGQISDAVMQATTATVDLLPAPQKFVDAVTLMWQKLQMLSYILKRLQELIQAEVTCGQQVLVYDMNRLTSQAAAEAPRMDVSCEVYTSASSHNTYILSHDFLSAVRNYLSLATTFLSAMRAAWQDQQKRADRRFENQRKSSEYLQAQDPETNREHIDKQYRQRHEFSVKRGDAQLDVYKVAQTSFDVNSERLMRVCGLGWNPPQVLTFNGQEVRDWASFFLQLPSENCFQRRVAKRVDGALEWGEVDETNAWSWAKFVTFLDETLHPPFLDYVMCAQPPTPPNNQPLVISSRIYCQV